MWKETDNYKSIGEDFNIPGKRELIARHAVRTYLKRIQNRFDDLKDLSVDELSKVDEYVFRLRDGSTVKDWHGAFEILMKKSGLHLDKHGDKRTLYSLRHTYYICTYQRN